MIEPGPYGSFYAEIGAGSFDIDLLATILRRFDCELDEVHLRAREISEEEFDPSELTSRFLALQSTSFGAKAVGWVDSRWVVHNFRRTWFPTATSNRRYPVLPYMPKPKTVLERVDEITRRCRGITSIVCDANHVATIRDAVYYVDPPYDSTTSYPYELDLERLLVRLRTVDTWISEGIEIEGGRSIKIESNRSKGMRGNQKKASEWLTFIKGEVR
jgi:hypothetical protein